jgi:hypothetical protein
MFKGDFADTREEQDLLEILHLKTLVSILIEPLLATEQYCLILAWKEIGIGNLA